MKYGMILILGIAHVTPVYGLFLLYEQRARGRLFIVFVIQYELISMLGITIGVHRLWSHKAFKAKLRSTHVM